MKTISGLFPAQHLTQDGVQNPSCASHPVVARAATRWVLQTLPGSARCVTNLTALALASLLAACSTTPSVSLVEGSSTRSIGRNEIETPQVVEIAPKTAAAAESQGILAHPLPPIMPWGTIGRVPQATDPLRPGIDPLKDPDPRADLWSRLRSGFIMPELDNDIVRGREQWYSSRPDYVERMVLRGSRYLFHVIEEVERRKMPSELALLPFIESAFNPEALSSAKASGMWQFMPATGKDFALKQNIFRDDRRNVLASTRAALDYLQRLHGMFGDWHLALAAYNWGEGNVQRAINRNKAAGLPTDYSSLRMPLETQQYVPKLQAVKNIIANPDTFGLRLLSLENHPYFLSVPIDRDIDVDLAARLARLPVNEFKALNPQMNKPLILAAGTPQILLPYDNANQFVRNLAVHRGAMASWTAWVAPKTIRTADAARQWNMSEDALREINRIPPKMLVKAGSTLLVPRHSQSPERVAEHIVDNAVMSLTPEPPPLRRMVVKARQKETLTGLARRYKATNVQLAEWNKLSPNASLKAGQPVVVYVPHSFKVAKAESPQRSSASQQRRVTVAAASREVRMAASSTRKPQHASTVTKVRVASTR